MFKRGSLVWGKMKSYPWWPAIVIDPEDCGRDRIKNDKLWLFWFGDHKITQVDANNVLDFEEYFREKSIYIKGKPMKKAVQELLIVSARNHQFECFDTSTLFCWAKNGFKTASGIVCEGANNELPDIVLQTLEKDDFKRKEIDETDSDDDICKVVELVRNGSTNLEDICIICCKFPSLVLMEHPLFIGGVCQNCEKCADRIKKTEFGQIQEICVVCGQGGKLVYCSNNICLRSYCDLCLDYMVSSGSFWKAVKSENWRCYLCKPDSDENCLIKQRCKYESKTIPAPSFPNEKLPISVLAQNEAVLQVLKKKNIEVDYYFTECFNFFDPNNRKRYVDFTEDEFHKIRADLVHGSFFTTSEDIKSNVELFSSAFFKFLYRLDNAKLHKPSVFFIFITNAGLNSEILSRVLRFVEVDPFVVKIQEKRFFVWSNIPSFSYNECKYLHLKVDESKSVEEEILLKFLDSLKLYFKCKQKGG